MQSDDAPQPGSVVRNGFTLIELLVVIAIISLLVSILLPSLTAAKELARSSVCASQQRSLYLGFIYYTEDWEGHLPAPCTLVVDGKVTYDRAIGGPYLDDPVRSRATPEEAAAVKSVFICPSDILPRTEVNAYNVPARSYAMVAHTYPGWPYAYQVYAIKLSVYPRPAEQFLTTEWHWWGNVRTRNWPGAWISQNYWELSYEPYLGQGWPQVGFIPSEDKYHRTGMNYLFKDGHVEFLRPDEAVADKYWDPE